MFVPSKVFFKPLGLEVAIFYKVCFCFNKLLRLSLYIMLVLMRWWEWEDRCEELLGNREDIEKGGRKERGRGDGLEEKFSTSKLPFEHLSVIFSSPHDILSPLGHRTRYLEVCSLLFFELKNLFCA